MKEENMVVYIDPDLEELIPGFLENRNKDVLNLKSASAEGNFDSLKSIGHSLKGVGGGYGFARITEIGGEIESSAKMGDIERIKKCITLLEEFLNKVEVKFE